MGTSTIRSRWVTMSDLPKVPTWAKTGVLWVVVAAAFATWTGWLEPPWVRLARETSAREAYEVAIDAQQKAADRAILVLQMEQQHTSQELAMIRAKLDEMAMVLYSMERRTR